MYDLTACKFIFFISTVLNKLTFHSQRHLPFCLPSSPETKSFSFQSERSMVKKVRPLLYQFAPNLSNRFLTAEHILLKSLSGGELPKVKGRNCCTTFSFDDKEVFSSFGDVKSLSFSVIPFSTDSVTCLPLKLLEIRNAVTRRDTVVTAHVNDSFCYALLHSTSQEKLICFAMS